MDMHLFPERAGNFLKVTRPQNFPTKGKIKLTYCEHTVAIKNEDANRNSIVTLFNSYTKQTESTKDDATHHNGRSRSHGGTESQSFNLKKYWYL
jgi:hypothetical protein